MTTREVSIEEARAKLGDLVRDAQQHAMTTFVTRNGKLAAIVAPVPAIVVRANVVDGYIEVQTGDWADGDPRWEYITDGAYLCDRTEVEPWGADEENLDRATEAVRDDMGLIVGPWKGDPGDQFHYATVTGRIRATGTTREQKR